MSILEGQYLPKDNKQERRTDIVLIGEKPSEYFVKHPEKRYLGNYNVTGTDMRFQKYIRKYLGQVYITDMVKTEGKAGADFESEWNNEPIHKQSLTQELQKINPAAVGALGRKVERLVKKEFGERYKIVYLIHPAAAFRYPNQRAKGTVNSKN
jgi:hypothetical protein